MVQPESPVLVLFYDQGGSHLFAGTSGERFRCNLNPLRMRLFKAEGAIGPVARPGPLSWTALRNKGAVAVLGSPGKRII
jgi:hypothetical protein